MIFRNSDYLTEHQRLVLHSMMRMKRAFKMVDVARELGVSGFGGRKTPNALRTLCQMGFIKTIKRGVYVLNEENTELMDKARRLLSEFLDAEGNESLSAGMRADTHAVYMNIIWVNIESMKQMLDVIREKLAQYPVYTQLEFIKPIQHMINEAFMNATNPDDAFLNNYNGGDRIEE